MKKNKVKIENKTKQRKGKQRGKKLAICFFL